MFYYLLTLLGLAWGIPFYLYQYIRNEHRIPVSQRLSEALKTESEVIVYFKAGGYRWTRRIKLERKLRKIGVTRIKRMHDQYDAVIAILTPSQIAIMSTKRWLPGMSLASEEFAIEEAQLRSNFDTYKRFDQKQLEQSLKTLHERYQL